MKVRVETDDPKALWQAIKKATTDGTITVWKVDDEGDLTHTKPRNNVMKAWFHPTVTSTELRFKIVPPKDEALDDFSYAWHHGKLIQMLLNHFRADATSIKLV
jgi:hypothetical protein